VIVATQDARRRAVEAATSWHGMHWGWADIADPGTFWNALRRQRWPSRHPR
jgi:hypothetical protein